MSKEKKKVLIVEDDEAIVRIYVIKLQKEGVETEVAIDGEDAMEKLKNFTPDVILLDLMLPKRDGFAVLKDIKKNSELKDVPVIILSNLGQKTDEEKAAKMGAVKYLVKTSVSIKDVVGTVLSLFD